MNELFAELKERTGKEWQTDRWHRDRPTTALKLQALNKLSPYWALLYQRGYTWQIELTWTDEQRLSNFHKKKSDFETKVGELL